MFLLTFSMVRVKLGLPNMVPFHGHVDLVSIRQQSQQLAGEDAVPTVS